jgi:hypothetical protein
MRGEIFMRVHTSDVDFLIFHAAYQAKTLLIDSTQRTRKGYEFISEGSILSGIGSILLARIESATSVAIVALTTIFLSILCVPILPLFLIGAIVVKVGSLIPGPASLQVVRELGQKAEDLIGRTLKVSFAAFFGSHLFLGVSTINTLLPLPLRSGNPLFRSIHTSIEPLGPLKRIEAIIPGTEYQDQVEVTGSEEPLSLLEEVEDYVRALSPQNILRKVEVQQIERHYTYQI